MSNSKIIKSALVNSLLAVFYIGLVATFLNNAQKLFGQEDTVLSGMAFLLTFVFSVAMMGMIIFARPIIWYLDGFKKEAVRLVFYTLGFLFIALVIIFLIIIFLLN